MDIATEVKWRIIVTGSVSGRCDQGRVSTTARPRAGIEPPTAETGGGVWVWEGCRSAGPAPFSVDRLSQWL